MTWPVYVINMAQNTTRMAHVTAELARLGVAFQRIEAVDGRALSRGELDRVYDPAANRKRFKHAMIGPEIGCYLSHIAIWEKVAAGPHDGAIVLEDDFASADDLAQVITALAADTGDWDIAKLFSARKDQKLLHRRSLSADRDIALPYKIPNTTLGYAIRRQAAVQLAGNALPMSRPIDEDHKHFWEHGLRVAVVAPCPLSFGTHSTEAGTITAARSTKAAQPKGAALWQGLRMLRYRIRFLMNLHWHRCVRRVR
jgi:glycosyl transferase family 25